MLNGLFGSAASDDGKFYLGHLSDIKRIGIQYDPSGREFHDSTKIYWGLEENNLVLSIDGEVQSSDKPMVRSFGDMQVEYHINMNLTVQLNAHMRPHQITSMIVINTPTLSLSVSAVELTVELGRFKEYFHFLDFGANIDPSLCKLHSISPANHSS